MEKYQLSFSATNIPRRWSLAKPSPYVTAKILSGTNQGKDLGETEIIESTTNAEWVEVLFFECSMAEKTELEVILWDSVRGKEPVPLTKITIDAKAVFNKKGKFTNEQIGRRQKCLLNCHVEKSQLGPASGNLRFQMRGLDIKNIEPGLFGLGRSDPFFEISKKDFDYSISYVKWNVVYRSEFIKDHLNPFWKPTYIDIEKLCYGDLDRELKITVLDHDNNGNHDVIGEYLTTAAALQDLVSYKGNADREKAVKIGDEITSKTYGFLCILAANIE